MSRFIKPLGSDGWIVMKVDPPHHGMRLDAYLAHRMPWRTRASIQRLIRDRRIRLEERSVKGSRRVLAGETIAVELPPPRRDLEAGKGEPELPVLYEDRHLLAVDKPPDIPVHPAGRLLHRTVITTLRRRYGGESTGETSPLKLCHRLDLETSGVLLVAKTERALVDVGRQIRERTIDKAYLALVYGEVEVEEQMIDLPIGPAIGALVVKKRAIRHDCGQPARTRIRVRRRLPGHTLLEVDLLTGRHHQIRVHLAAIGHPIVGDKIYGPDESYFLMDLEGELTEEARRRLMLPRQALHAHRLSIDHPINGERLTITSELRADVANLIDGLARRG